MAETTGEVVHRVPIKEDFEGRHGVAYHEVRSKYREPQNIQESFQVALEVLDILFSNKVLHQNENKSKRIRTQLQNQTVAISVLGRHGVGKSTLLDSLLMQRLLPTHRKNNTAVMVTIEHSPDMENGPRLLDSQKQLVATGKEEILKFISTENDSVRTNNKMIDDLYLQLDCPILNSASGDAKPVLVDTPGFGEAGGALIDRIAGESLEGCSACLMVMAYTMLRDEADMEILGQLHGSDPDLSNGRRIVIAVTQHDHYYTGKQDEELSADTTQDHVHEGLQQLGYMVPREQIVVVSGEWALMARELAKNPGNRELFQRARKFLTFYKDTQAKGDGKEDYDAFEEVAGMNVETVARELEEASNIKDLEARVVEMSGRCNDILLSSAKNKVSYYLQQALDELNIHLETACNKYQAEQREEERISVCVAEVEKQKAAISQTIVAGEGSNVHISLKEKVDRETEVACNKTQRVIRRKLFQLRTQSLEKVQAQMYTTELYHEDLNSVEEELGTVLRNAMNSTLYSRSQSKSNRYMQYRVPTSFYRMEGVVRELGGASDVPRMVSTPEPEPVEVDEPIIEEESEEEEEELNIGASAATLNDEVHEGGEGEGEGERGER
ncbi:hypothetical protein GBAR_LOCUS14856 [Geodia barretti]|uniref:Dynamin N-terminal domain-containing protein n=2 Tax=Geodia barretti TaxID=519541 RepID=A0AA35S939_GEOBA|nr:hypothetical protein GBAR_LOCUS14856 [Geodia barretti]